MKEYKKYFPFLYTRKQKIIIQIYFHSKKKKNYQDVNSK